MPQSGKRNLFNGFSTADTERTRDFKLSDLALIRRDLLNHFYTRRGERVMRPDFGCKIWDYLHEPMTGLLRNVIEAEALRIVQSDSRLALLSFDVNEIERIIRIDIDVDYLPFNVIETFTVEFEKRQGASNAQTEDYA